MSTNSRDLAPIAEVRQSLKSYTDDELRHAVEYPFECESTSESVALSALAAAEILDRREKPDVVSAFNAFLAAVGPNHSVVQEFWKNCENIYGPRGTSGEAENNAPWRAISLIENACNADKADDLAKREDAQAAAT